MQQIVKLEKAAVIVAFIVVASALLRQALDPPWKKFTSAEGAFTVLLPAAPKAENQSTVLSGLSIETHSFSAFNRTGANFTVSYTDAPALHGSSPLGLARPATWIEKFLDAQGQILTHGDPNRMISAEKLVVNGYPVRLYKARTDEDLEADEKVYLVNQRLYILLVVHDKGREQDDVKKFFDSFTFQPRS